MAGLMMTAAMPPFHGTAWLAPLALAMLLAALARTTHPARTGWWFGLAHQATLLHWLFLLIPAAPVLNAWLVPASAIAAILYCSLFYLLLGWAFGRVRSWLGRPAVLALSPVLWTGMEAWRAAGELGFPWCLSGAAWIDTPVRTWAATAGEIGLGAGTAFLAAALVAAVELWQRWREGRHRRAAAVSGRLGAAWRVSLLLAAAFLIAALAAGTGWRGSREPMVAGGHAGGDSLIALRQEPVRIAAVQANVDLADKWMRAKIDSTRIPYGRLTERAAAAGAQLVVWAETAVPSYLLHDPEMLEWISGLAATDHVFIYAGFPDAWLEPDGAALRYNSSGLFGPEGQLIDRYAKHHLLPIGERMPFQGLVPALGKIDVGQAEWMPGEPPRPLLVEAAGGPFTFAGLICFESIFSDLARGAVRGGAQYLVNITNDGWFGASAGPRQHAAMARLRAAECGVPLVRCANNGISFLTDDRGAILVRAGLDQRTFLEADLPPGTRSTLFVRAGAWPLAGFLLAWSIIAVVITWKGRRS
jgi:apolipoprotein N-acyltransferase